MSFFAFILIIIFFLLFFALSLAANLINMCIDAVRSILRALGIGGKTEYKHSNTNTHGRTSRQSSQQYNPASNGKIFGADEGEYVDFEEIKE